MRKMLEELYAFCIEKGISPDWVMYSAAIAILVVPLLTLFINVLKWSNDRKNFNLQESLADRESSRLELKDIDKKLTEFYLPLRYFLTQSKMLYDTFALAEKESLRKEGKNFNTLRFLCDGRKFSESDRSILETIINIGEAQNKIIEEKNWTTENNALSNLLSKYSAHLKILNLAHKGNAFGKSDLYKDYVFPIELPGAIESSILGLTEKKELLIKGVTPKINTPATIKRYGKEAEQYYNATISIPPPEDFKKFKSLVKSGGLICDLGCGSGRDSIALIQSGFRVFSTEPSKQLARLARNYPFIYVREESILEMSYPARFDAILCSAVLQHVSTENLPIAIQNLSSMLNKYGILYLSFRSTAAYRERFFDGMTLHPRDKTRAFLISSGFEILEEKESTSKKDNENKFHSFIAKKIG